MGKSKAKSAERRTKISARNAVVGRVAGTGHLEVRGRIEGEVEMTGDIAVAEGGLVEGTLSGEVITILGTVRGDVSARDTLRIGAKAKVEASISAPNLIIETGARVNGPVRMTRAATIYDERPPDMATQVTPTPQRQREASTEVGPAIFRPEPLFVSIAEPTIRVKGSKKTSKRVKKKRLAVKVRKRGGSFAP